MWTREKRPNNILINDPKGELLKAFYAAGTYRGFQIVQFNLINAMNTDIFNPLGLASEAAREGDFVKVAAYVENIAEVFFPLDGGEDPVWPNAANNAFKRAVYGLIDYVLEEELRLRDKAEKEGVDPKVLETQIDLLWGQVTLYNCYQLFVQLTSKKMKNPRAEFERKVKAGYYADKSPDVIEAMQADIAKRSELWNDAAEVDLLTLFFNATERLPKNQMRTLVGNANNALKSMAGAEKMLASVYGIAVTAMSFFADPTISTLTSGTLSQNVDLAGLSFPRRLGFRMKASFIEKYHLLGMQCSWSAYADANFTQSLGDQFTHEDLINRAGWARFYFEGTFPTDTAYLKCEIKNPQSNQLLRTFYFKFTKMYQTTLNGRMYLKDPILGDKIVRNGVMTELRPVTDKSGQIVSFEPGHVTFKELNLALDPSVEDPDDLSSVAQVPVKTDVPVITQYMLRYSEKPKMIFLVTPPHLMKYAKIVLILLKQLVDLNFDQSYMTKDSQKPLYKTRFMLDELGLRYDTLHR